MRSTAGSRPAASSTTHPAGHRAAHATALDREREHTAVAPGSGTASVLHAARDQTQDRISRSPALRSRAGEPRIRANVGAEHRLPVKLTVVPSRTRIIGLPDVGENRCRGLSAQRTVLLGPRPVRHSKRGNELPGEPGARKLRETADSSRALWRRDLVALRLGSLLERGDRDLRCGGEAGLLGLAERGAHVRVARGDLIAGLFRGRPRARVLDLLRGIEALLLGGRDAASGAGGGGRRRRGR
jgi:hypothetical protein